MKTLEAAIAKRQPKPVDTLAERHDKAVAVLQAAVPAGEWLPLGDKGAEVAWFLEGADPGGEGRPARAGETVLQIRMVANAPAVECRCSHLASHSRDWLDVISMALELLE